MREFERLSDGAVRPFDAEASLAKARAERDAGAIVVSKADADRIRREAGG